MIKSPEIVPIRRPFLSREELKNRIVGKNKKYKSPKDNSSKLGRKGIEEKKKKIGGHHLFIVDNTVVSGEDFAEGKIPDNVKEI